MVEVALLSCVTAWIAFTLSEAAVFESAREWAKSRSRWLGKLLGCGYCLGFWIALALETIYQPRVLRSWWPLDHLLTALVIAWLAGAWWAVMCWLTRAAGK
jgi:hypothetical protein